MKDPRDEIPLDPDAPPSEEELAAAEELRLALEDPARASEEAELARALALANEPRPLPEDVHAAIVAGSLAKLPAKREERGRVIRVAFGSALAAVAIAAGVFLWLQVNGTQGTTGPQATMAAPLPLVQVRSTAPLFHEPFDSATTSARIDRIAIARADDYRENMYARWGVR